MLLPVKSEPSMISNCEVPSVVNEAKFGEAEDINRCVDDIATHVHQIEKQVKEVEVFYSTKNTDQNSSRSGFTAKEKAKEKHVRSSEKQQQDVACRAASAANRMQELIRQFASVYRQITQHKWAWPFMQPVDVHGLNLRDYHKLIKKPMDLGTIKRKMEAKDGSTYTNVRDLYADVRLVFKNAIAYNCERDDVYVMASTLLEKLEEKWLQLLPKVVEEERKQAGEDTEVKLNMKVVKEAAHASMVKDLYSELSEIDMQLERLRDAVIQKCKKMSTEEKKKLGTALTRLSPEDLDKALKIVAEYNPAIDLSASVVNLDIDDQSEFALWKLKVFVQELQTVESKNSEGGIGNDISDNNINNKNVKRRREISQALTKNAIKRTRR